MTLFLLPPLAVGTAHLLTDSRYSIEFAVQWAVIAAMLVLLGDMAGHRAAWCVSAPVLAACASGVLVHRVGNASLRPVSPTEFP